MPLTMHMAYTMCPENVLNIFDYNLKKNHRILTFLIRIFLRQLDIKLLCSSPPYPMSASALPGKISTNEILHFYLKWYYYLI